MKRSLQNIIKIWKLLDNKHRDKLFLIIIFMFIISVGEILTLFCIKPLIALITANQESTNNFSISILNQFDNNYKLIFLGITIVILIISLNSIKIIYLWQINRISASIGTLIGVEIFSEQALAKYYDYDKEDSSLIISALTNQLFSTVTSIINFLKALSSILVCIFITAGLLILDFKKNLIAIILFLSIYLITYLSIEDRLKKISEIIKIKSESQIKIIKDVIGANKEILSNNLQPNFREKYKFIDWELRRAKANSGTFKIIPRLIIEASAITFLVTIAIFNNLEKSNSIAIISYIGSLAFGIQRIMPSLQTIYASWSYIIGETASVSNIVNLLNFRNDSPININIKNKIDFSSLELKDIDFYYENSETKKRKYIFKKFKLLVKKGERIAIVGKTGTGKSTLIDLITGIIKPKAGIININNKNIHKTQNISFLYAWRNYYSYLPQKPYLTEGTILENIAFSENTKEFNFFRVKECAKKAKIYEFINSLPNKFKTKIGEMGSKLSGGQAQRIGLARALYSNKEIIIMDEVTSSLDEKTEREIIETINDFDPNMTLIIISHKKSFLEICNRIIDLDTDYKLS